MVRKSDWLRATNEGKSEMSSKIVLPVEVDAEDFWSNVLGSAWETWDWWVRLDYSEGSDWDKLGEITITAQDPNADWEDEQPTITKTLTVEDLAAAYGKCISEGHRFNLEDLDASDGDCVIQMAMFGEVVYG